MEKNGFKIKTRLPATPDAIYRAWLSGAEHSAMTGGKATASDKPGGSFTAWDGYIWGKNLELKPHWCIVQSWRTTQFADGDPDSRLELCIHASGDGSELLLIHSDIPPDQMAGYESGWAEYYFEPMRAYFSAKQRKKAAKKPAGKTPAKAAKKKSAKKSTRKTATKKKTAKKKATKRRARRR
jgi:activator of HSP90 ATPase